MSIPTLALSNDTTIPLSGFGCAFGHWTGGDVMQGFLPEQAWRALTLAFDAGFRHFDTAYCYGTERHLGDVLGRAMAEGRVERSDLFITTKVAHPPSPPHVAISHRLTWNWRNIEEIRRRVRDDFDASKEKLGMGYVDLLLMHWPGDFSNEDPAFAKEARAAIWEEFEAFLKRGDARAIGVCNATQRHLQEFVDAGGTLPMVNQVELHPYCQDPALTAFCREHGIVVEAYAPFASGAFGLLQDPAIVSVASEVGRSTGQAILRWHLQQGHVVLPKSGNAKRIAQNLDLFDFELSDEQMARISGVRPPEPKRSTVDPESVL